MKAVCVLVFVAAACSITGDDKELFAPDAGAQDGPAVADCTPECAAPEVCVAGVCATCDLAPDPDDACGDGQFCDRANRECLEDTAAITVDFVNGVDDRPLDCGVVGEPACIRVSQAIIRAGDEGLDLVRIVPSEIVGNEQLTIFTSVRVIGFGAYLTSSFGTAIAVRPDGDVTIEGLSILNSSSHGILTEPGSATRLYRVTIRGSAGDGVNASGIGAENNTNLEIEASVFSDNRGSGVRSNEVNFRMRNSLVANNDGFGMTLDFGALTGPTPLALELSTIADNGMGAIICATAQDGAGNFVGNIVDEAPCAPLIDLFTHSFIGPPTGEPTNLSTMPMFEAGTYQLAPGDPAIDHVPASFAEADDIDSSGVPRPIGNGLDVGAFEFQP